MFKTISILLLTPPNTHITPTYARIPRETEYFSETYKFNENTHPHTTQSQSSNSSTISRPQVSYSNDIYFLT